MATQRRDAGHTGQSIEQVRSLAWLLDNSIPIPGTRIRIGLDPILGLIPGLGDAAGAILSSYILFQAGRLGVSRGTMLRMGLNVLVESVVGMIPLAGDLFDAGWKANQRNLKLLERSIVTPESARRGDRNFMLVLALSVGLAGAGLAGASILFLKWLLTSLF
jgi:hypothetical protein